MEFLLNGRKVDPQDVAPQTTLLDWLRAEGLTGAKEGCAEGECGACTVVLVKDRGAGSEYVPVNSCLMFLPMLAGQEVYTVEALARDGKLTAGQKAMAECGGSQCGYCTPGFVMSLFAEEYRPGRNGACRIEALGGNLCRCTGYRPIRDAALSLSAAPDDEFRRRLSRPAPAAHPLDYRAGNQKFYRPQRLDECLRLLADHEDAVVVAGATDMAVESNLAGRRWSTLISIEGVEELRVLRSNREYDEIGAGLTLSEIESRFTGAPAVFAEWFALFASPLIRNRATLGGNLATASPIGDGAPMLLALDAELKIAGPRGERLVPLDLFFRGYRKTVLERDELIVSVLLPKPYPEYARFYKVAKRRLDDISTVAACYAVDWDAAGKVQRARVAYGGVAATPLRVRAAEDALTGSLWDGEAVREAQEILAAQLEPLSDHRGSAQYRLAMTQTLLARFFEESREAQAA